MTPRLEKPTLVRSARSRPTGADPDEGRGTKGVGHEAVLLRSDPHPADGRHPIAPGRGTVPTATSTCECGRTRSAVGQRQVLALVADHTAHRTQCPIRTTQEGRDAA